MKSSVTFPTRTRIHMGLVVGNLDAARGFYESLFGQPATKVRPGYAKFEVVEPPVNFTLNESGDGPVGPSNVSHFGIDVAYAPLVPVSRVPMCLLMGRVEKRSWLDEKGELAVRPVITLSCTFDHRLLDGNKIGKMVRTVRAYMENPYAHEPDVGLPDPFAKTEAP